MKHKKEIRDGKRVDNGCKTKISVSMHGLKQSTVVNTDILKAT